MFERSQNIGQKSLNLVGNTPDANFPIRKLFQNRQGSEEQENQYRPMSCQLRETDKSDVLKDSTGEEHVSLTLSQSPESNVRMADKRSSKSGIKYQNYSDKLEANRSKPKQVSQCSLGSVQNNRYNQNFEGDRSGMSCSFGDRLLDNSRLVTEDYVSPSQSRTHKELSCYLRSQNATPVTNQDLMHENQNLIKNIKKSQDSIMKSPDVNSSPVVENMFRGRYNTSETNEPDEIHYNHTFSTFGPNDEIHEDINPPMEDRIRPARE